MVGIAGEMRFKLGFDREGGTRWHMLKKLGIRGTDEGKYRRACSNTRSRTVCERIQANMAVIGFTMSGRQIRFLLPLPDKSAKEFWYTPGRGQRRADDRRILHGSKPAEAVGGHCI